MPAGGKGTAPTFVVWAVKDPTSGNLDRLQIIKGWTKNGQSFEKIFDVAWAGDRKPDKWSGRVPAIQSTVNLETSHLRKLGRARRNSRRCGAIRSSTPACTPFTTPASWRFPRRGGRSFRPSRPGFRRRMSSRSRGRNAPGVRRSGLRHRAEAQKNAPAGMTVADLKKKGAAPLS